MKKIFILLLTVMYISTAFTDDFSEKGLISGWKFVPVQVGVGFFSPKQLFDTDSTALFSLGLLGVKQRSSIISLGAVSELKNNFSMPIAFISVADKNCGLMTGLLNGSGDNYGVKIGLFNIDGRFTGGQFAGIDFCNCVHLGIINDEAPLQIGVINKSRESFFQIGLLNNGKNKVNRPCLQIGLLNYNSKAVIPWLPLLNFSFEREEKMKPKTELNKLIFRQLERNELKPGIAFDPNQNSDVVYCRDFNNFPRPLDKKCIFSDCTDTELVQLFNAVIDCKPLDFDIICEICKMLPTKGYLVHDKLEKIILSSKFDPSDRELLFAYLGSDKKYETKIIELLDTIPTGFRYGLFLACFHLNTPTIFRKLLEKFTQWIKADPGYGSGTGEGQFLEKFIVLWQNTQDRELVNEFAAFCRKNWHYAKEEK